MIIDGKFIEENSIPLSRLMGSVVVTSDYNADNEALNTRISKIENLEMDSDMALQAFSTKAVNHFSTLINDTSTDTAPAHSIKAGTVTDAMLATALKDRIVYTDQNRTITATETFNGATTFGAAATFNETVAHNKPVTFTGSATSTEILKVAKGKTVLQTVSVTGLTDSGDASITGNVTISGNLTVSGTTSTVNSTIVTVTDRLIALNKNGAVPTQSLPSGIKIAVSGINDDVTGSSGDANIRLARLTYQNDGASGAGWYVRNYSTTNNNTSESKIVTEAYLTAQGYAASSNLETSIKNTLKKFIARGQATLAGTTGVSVNLASTHATFAANITNGDNYDVFVTLVNPATGNSATTTATNLLGVGEIQVVKNGNKTFKIFNTGTAASVTVAWMAVNRAIATVG